METSGQLTHCHLQICGLNASKYAKYNGQKTPCFMLLRCKRNCCVICTKPVHTYKQQQHQLAYMNLQPHPPPRSATINTYPCAYIHTQQVHSQLDTRPTPTSNRSGPQFFAFVLCIFFSLFVFFCTRHPVSHSHSPHSYRSCFAALYSFHYCNRFKQVASNARIQT